MNDNPRTKAKRHKKKEKEREIIIKIHIEEEPENPYKNLGAIGECMWKWKKYFDRRKKREK